ncbi:hypothetical protein [Caloranaerobacter ferrireducens]|uniref:hypothetical protein n=1 Tax=Caloranaerobacter ferrireducens TaxID=1323370 RepID=UPI00084D8EE3|nr:hypothetical protein [Caloranaerobacter ferrireducens]
MKNRIFVVLLICFSILILTNCQMNKINNAIEDKTKDITQNQNKQEHIKNNTPKQKQENIHKIVEENRINLFPDCKEYNGNEKKKIIIHGEEKTVKFVKIRFTYFGMYISDLIKVVEFEDGTEFQLNDNTETINVLPFEIETGNSFKEVKLLAEKFVEDHGPPLQVKKEEELQHYNEYLGSKTNEYGKRNDYFLFYVDNKNSAIVRLSYFLKNKERVLPIFLEEIKNIKYIDNNMGN